MEKSNDLDALTIDELLLQTYELSLPKASKSKLMSLKTIKEVEWQF